MRVSVDCATWSKAACGCYRQSAAAMTCAPRSRAHACVCLCSRCHVCCACVPCPLPLTKRCVRHRCMCRAEGQCRAHSSKRSRLDFGRACVLTGGDGTHRSSPDAWPDPCVVRALRSSPVSPRPFRYLCRLPRRGALCRCGPRAVRQRRVRAPRQQSLRTADTLVHSTCTAVGAVRGSLRGRVVYGDVL